MARYGSGGGYRGGRGFSSSRSGGFTNSRTGSYVSSTRAHQHSGQSIGGVTKTQSSKSGNYYMTPTKGK